MENIENHNSSSELFTFFIELRARLIRSLVAFLIVFALLFYQANTIYTLLAKPLLAYLPQGHLIATQIVSPFFVPVRLAFFTAILLIAPFILYQLYAFIAPALYKEERRWCWPFMLMGSLLFYSGVAFAYFAIFPMLFRFLANIAPIGVILSPDMSAYLDFTIRMLLVFGFLFEIPLVMVLLVSFSIVTYTQFKQFRPYAIIVAFIIGMLLAPPDVFSQTMLAIPVWLLYELGLLFSRVVMQHGKKN